MSALQDCSLCERIYWDNQFLVDFAIAVAMKKSDGVNRRVDDLFQLLHNADHRWDELLVEAGRNEKYPVDVASKIGLPTALMAEETRRGLVLHMKMRRPHSAGPVSSGVLKIGDTWDAIAWARPVEHA